MRWRLWFILSVTLCSGCRTTTKIQREYVTEIVEVHDTIRDLKVELIRDSIYLHDSIVVTKDVEGKVVYKEKYVYRDLWHDSETKIVHDSIVIYKDSKDREKETEKTVEKRPWYLPLAICCSILFMAAVLIYSLKKFL